MVETPEVDAILIHTAGPLRAELRAHAVIAACHAAIVPPTQASVACVPMLSRMNAARCEHCGYDVAGLTVEAGRAICPECGKSTVVASPAVPGLLRHAPWIILGLGSGPMLILSAILCCVWYLPALADEYLGESLHGLIRTALLTGIWIGLLTPVAVPLTLVWFDRSGLSKARWGTMAGLSLVANFLLGVITFVFYFFSPSAPNC